MAGRRMYYSQWIWVVGMALAGSAVLCVGLWLMVLWFDAGTAVTTLSIIGLAIVALIGGGAFASTTVEVSLSREGMRIEPVSRFHPYRQLPRTFAWHEIERAFVTVHEDAEAGTWRTLRVVVDGRAFRLDGTEREVESLRLELLQRLRGEGRAEAAGPSLKTLQQQVAGSKIYQWMAWTTAVVAAVMLGAWVLGLFG